MRRGSLGIHQIIPHFTGELLRHLRGNRLESLKPGVGVIWEPGDREVKKGGAVELSPEQKGRSLWKGSQRRQVPTAQLPVARGTSGSQAHFPRRHPTPAAASKVPQGPPITGPTPASVVHLWTSAHAVGRGHLPLSFLSSLGSGNF